MQPEAFLDPRPIGFGAPSTKKTFMGDEAQRIEAKLDLLIQQVNQILGAQPLRDEDIRGLKDRVRELESQAGRQDGMISLVKWAVPLISSALASGGAYVAVHFSG